MPSSYPIIEYDYASKAVFQPDQHDLGIHFPPCVAFPFVGDAVDAYAAEHDLPVIATYETVTCNYPVYRVSDALCLCQAPIGAPVAVQLMDWMICYGVERVISVASCGALVDLPENALVIPRRALRDEGTSYHYAPASDWIRICNSARVARFMEESGIPHVQGRTWTTDSFYRETRNHFEKHRAQGCISVEMECAALQAVCDFRQKNLYMFFTSGDLLDAEKWDERRLPGESEGTQHDTGHFRIALSLAWSIAGDGKKNV